MILKRLVLTSLVASMLVVPVSLAQTDETGNQSSEPTLVQTQNNTGEERRAEAQARLEERKAARQAEIEAKLDQARTTRLQNQCEAAQNRLQAAGNNAEQVYDSRTKVYQGVADRLNAVISRLTANHDLDTSTLEAEIANLQSKIDDFFIEFDAYIAAVDEATTAQNCSDDPTDFHTSLETAKILRQELKNLAAEIKAYAQNEVKTALQDLRAQLETDSTDSETDQSETDNDESDEQESDE